MSLYDHLRAIVLQVVGPRLDYLALYPARVVSQAANGRLDLVPEDARLDPCAGIPLRYGLPGVTATVPAGGRVLLGFEHGDPGRPYAALWESGEVTALSVAGGAARAAREGHAVHGGSLQIATSSLLGPTVFTIQYVSAAGVPQGSPQTVTLGADGDPKVIALSAGRIAEGANALRLP